MRNNKGFTLVELAIVLVIIGVILGGVMKGQQLVTSAKSKRVMRDFNTIQSAMYTYQDKTNKIPGDNATTPTGKVDGSTTAGQFWKDLRDENLYSGSGVTAPEDVFGGTMSVGSASNTTAGLARNSVCMSAIPAENAKIIDETYDDGNETSGTIHAGASVAASSDSAYEGASAVVMCFALD